MAAPLRILVICSKFPYPSKDGGTMAMMSMIRGFAQLGHGVTVLAMNTPKHYVKLSELPEEVHELASFIAVGVDTRVRLLDALANLIFSRESYHVQRFQSKAFRAELSKVLTEQEFDVVQAETLFMATYLDTIRALAPKALVSYRAHNVEHEIWSRRAANELNPIKKMVLETTALRIEAYEKEVLGANGFDCVVPITGRDAGLIADMGSKMPSFVCPAGLDMSAIQAAGTREIEWPSLFYLGALDWEPNKEGLRWFLKKVWPIVKKFAPQLRLYLAGRNMPAEFRQLRDSQIVALGEVENATDFMQDKAIMVVPILSGSGMRVKLLEGMAHRKAIVATRVAAEGFGLRSGEHVFFADEPQEFANAILTLAENRALYNFIADKAFEFVEHAYANSKVVGGLVSFYEKQRAGRQG